MILQNNLGIPGVTPQFPSTTSLISPAGTVDRAPRPPAICFNSAPVNFLEFSGSGRPTLVDSARPRDVTSVFVRLRIRPQLRFRGAGHAHYRLPQHLDLVVRRHS